MTRARADYEIAAHDRTERAFSSVKRRLRDAGTAFGGFARTAAVALGAGGFAAAVKRVIDDGDQIGKLSTRLGASTQSLSELSHAASLTGVQSATLTMGMQRMTRRVAEAAQGTGEARTALAELGLDARTLTSLAPDQQFEAIADAMAGVSNEGDRVRLAMKLFDSEGVALLQTMEGGSLAIRQMRAEARELGLSLSGEQAAQFAAANDAMTRMGGAFRGVFTELATNLAPLMEKFGNFLSRVVGPVIDLVSTGFRNLGNLIGANAAVISAVLRGEFSEAWDTAKMAIADFASGGGESLKSFEKIVDATFGEVTQKAVEAAQAPAAAIDTAGLRIARRTLAEQRARVSGGDRASRESQIGQFSTVDRGRFVATGAQSAVPQEIKSTQISESNRLLSRIAQILQQQQGGAVLA